LRDDAVDASPQHLGKLVLPQVQRQRPEVVARAHQDVERVELDLLIMLAAMQAVEVGDAVDASSTDSPSTTKESTR
jgi:hypothetical protein